MTALTLAVVVAAVDGGDMTHLILPVNATRQELALEGAMADRIDAIAADPIRTVNDPLHCPAAVLPALAWSRSVDVYNRRRRSRPVAARLPRPWRCIVLRHPRIGRGGTVGRWGSRRKSKSASVARLYNGKTRHDGVCLYGRTEGGALYRVILKTPLRNDQAGIVYRLWNRRRQRCANWCRWIIAKWQTCTTGAARADGAYNHGSILMASNLTIPGTHDLAPGSIRSS
jgi:hypothetical protein